MRSIDAATLGDRALRRVAALAAALVLLVAACGGPAPSGEPGGTAGPSTSPTTGPSPTPLSSAAAAAVYRTIEDQVIAERGLPAKQRLEPTILSEAQLKTRMAAAFAADNPPDQIAVAEGTLKALGLLPADASLSKLYVDMLGSQVAGYYDPRAKELFVVSRSGQIGAVEKVTFAHEFTHALQDQNFGLEGIDVDAVGQGDRSLARLALVEGDATLLMTRWLSQNLDAAEMQDLLAIDPATLQQLAAMPAILRETLLFPYQQGMTFVSSAWASGGWSAVDRLYARLPDSTEQILHPDKYAADEKPVAVALDGAAIATRMGSGWSATTADTLGELQLSIWLRENGVDVAAAQQAAAGWGGDRIEYLRGPGGTYALALVTAWDTQHDADEFLAAAKDAIAHLPGASMVGSGGARMVRLFAASDAATLARLGAAFPAAPGG